MISQDFLFYALGGGFLILVGFASHAFYSLAKTLKEITLILEKVDNIVRGIEDLKNAVQVGISSLKSMFSKGGERKRGK